MKPLWLFVVITAVFLRLLLFSVIALTNQENFLQPDSGGYMALAENLNRHGVFSSASEAPYAPEYNRTPVYPAFLALLKTAGLGVKGIVIAQLILSVAGIMLVMYLCSTVLGLSKLSAAVAGLIIASDIPSIVLVNSLLTETLFTFLLATAVITLILFYKKKTFKHLVVSGLFFGLCSLCRPSAVFLPLFAAAALVFALWNEKKKALAGALILMAVYAMTVSPWLMRNKLLFGGPFLSTISYDNLLFVQGGGVRSVTDAISLEEAKNRIALEYEAKYAEELKTAGLLASKRLEGEMAKDIILAHPFIYASNYTKAVFGFLFKPIRNDIDIMLGLTDRRTSLDTWGQKAGGFFARLLASTSPFTLAASFFQFAVLLAVYFFTGLALISARQLDKGAVLVTAAVILYFCLISGAPEIYARFRVPVVPMLAVLAAMGFEHALKNKFFKREAL